MKKRTSSIRDFRRQFFVISMVCLMVGSVAVQSHQLSATNEIAMSYTFNVPTVTTVDIAGTLYDRIVLDDCYPAGSAGEPKLPSMGVFLLIPPQSQVSSITITPGKSVVLGSDFLIEPTSQAIPLSQTQDIPIPTPNEAMYGSSATYPGRLFTKVGVQQFRGYQILVLLLHPVQYTPLTGELLYYSRLDVSVDTVPTDGASIMYRGVEQDRREVRQRVDNPEMVLQYDYQCTPVCSFIDDYDLLIITTDALKTGFDPLKQAHDATGVQTVIKTLTDIGASDLESIRNYIRTAYQDWGIEYVLIGGDNNVVAAPMLWVSGMDENVTYYEETMPSDIYYACLDGPYNYDGDTKWGEPTDGESGGDVDLVAEVYVGRACVGSMTEVNNFVAKTIEYINKDINDPYLKKYCLAGEYLGDYGIASYGGNYLNQFINGSSDDGYTTVGIPASDYTINKLYDTPSYDWPPSAIISVINNGVHVINHLGHASYDYNLKLDNYDVDALSNPTDETCFIYSQGCMAGGFDSGDCIAEHFTVKTTHAAFAVIMNARYGFFWSYSTDGDSQRLHRQFWDAVFGEMKPQLGKASHDSKEDNLPIIGRSCIRWVYYETNLFGDPALSLTEQVNQPPGTPAVPTGPTSGTTAVDFTFTTSTTDPEADEVYYQWDFEDEVSEWFGPYPSGQSVETVHAWMAPGEYQVKVKAKDSNGQESAWSDAMTIAIIAGPHIEIGVISGGLKVTAEVLNTGVVNASEVNWTIRVEGLVFFGQQKSGTIPTIDPDGSDIITTGILFGLGTVEIVVSAADAEKTATAFLLGPFILNLR
ncbi:MAG: PKD domain-containing protein [Candidatus Thermoplasmatota archaeon]|nr:PKD domain-containing protein [Candidatus Thermoplasmatota archaeon]